MIKLMINIMADDINIVNSVLGLTMKYIDDCIPRHIRFGCRIFVGGA